jgi:hypothetical protein
MMMMMMMMTTTTTTWKSIGLQKVLEYKSLSYKQPRLYEFKQHKPWFDEECY